MGLENPTLCMVDALSWQEEFEEGLNSLLVVENPIIITLQQANVEFEEWDELKLKCNKNELDPQYTIREGLLYYRDLLLVPDTNELKHVVLLMFHSTPIAGYGGV